jgi:MFS transporter, ACDE family, multidrug resistance protein
VAAKGKPWGSLAVLCLVPFVMVLGNSMLIPVMPEMGREWGVDKPTAGLVVTTFSVAAGLGIAVAGYLADRFGRKVVIVPALVLYGLGGILSGVAGMWLAENSMALVLAGRVLQGIGAAGTMPVAMALTGDLFKDNSRVTALGVLEASNGLGKVLSPILGALAGLIAWWFTFFGYAAVALPAALAVWFFVKEPKREKKDAGLGDYFQRIKKVFQTKGVPLVACFWAGTVALFILFGILFYLSEHLENEHGVDGLPKGFLIMWPVLAMSITAFATGLFLQKHRDLLKPAVVSGFALGTAGTALVAFYPDDWTFFTGIIVNGIGTGLVLPGLNNLITSATGTEQRAGITAAYGAVRFFGVAAGPPLYGLLMKMGDAVPFWFSALVEAGTLAVVVFLVNPGQLIGKGEGGGDGGPKQGKQVPGWKPPEGLPVGTRRYLR